MKKLWLLLLLASLAAILLTGCASSAGSLSTPTPGNSGAQNNLIPNLTATGTPGPSVTNLPSATGIPENGNNGAAAVQRPEDVRDASKKMADAIERLSEVDDAYVLALGDTALVGLEFALDEPSYTRWVVYALIVLTLFLMGLVYCWAEKRVLNLRPAAERGGRA